MKNQITILFCLVFLGFSAFVSAQNCSNSLLQNGDFTTDLNSWNGQGGTVQNGALQLCQTGDVMRQTISAEAGKTYQFHYTAKTLGTNQNVLFGLKFLDASWIPLDSEYSSFDSPGAFSSNFIEKMAPSGAVYVEVSIGKTNSGCVEVEEVCLTNEAIKECLTKYGKENLLLTEQMDNGNYRTISQNVSNLGEITITDYSSTGNILKSEVKIHIPEESYRITTTNNIIRDSDGSVEAQIPMANYIGFTPIKVAKKKNGTTGWYVIFKKDLIADSTYLVNFNANMEEVSKKVFYNNTTRNTENILTTNFGYIFYYSAPLSGSFNGIENYVYAVRDIMPLYEEVLQLTRITSLIEIPFHENVFSIKAHQAFGTGGGHSTGYHFKGQSETEEITFHANEHFELWYKNHQISYEQTDSDNGGNRSGFMTITRHNTNYRNNSPLELNYEYNYSYLRRVTVIYPPNSYPISSVSESSSEDKNLKIIEGVIELDSIDYNLNNGTPFKTQEGIFNIWGITPTDTLFHFSSNCDETGLAPYISHNISDC